MELKLQRLDLNRYWLATETEAELQNARDDFVERIAPSKRACPNGGDHRGD